MRRCLALALACALAGCVSPGSREAQHYYVLEAAGAAPAPAQARGAATLLVAPTTAAGFYDTQEIVYSRAPGTRATYQFNRWTERPARRINALLMHRLERTGAFATVASATSGVKGALLLSTHLEELYHDAAVPPGSARVTLTAELTDPAKRTLVARRTFSRSAPAASYDAAAAVAAFGEALDPLLSEVAGWVERSAAPAR